jgi:small subunit ribosomal protein S6
MRDINMKQYEIMAIYKAELGEQGAKTLSEKVKSLIESISGKVTKNDYWGKRKFTYEIKHQTEGYYDVMNFEFDSAELAKLKTKLNQLTEVVRYLITAKS